MPRWIEDAYIEDAYADDNLGALIISADSAPKPVARCTSLDEINVDANRHCIENKTVVVNMTFSLIMWLYASVYSCTYVINRGLGDVGNSWH